MRPLHGLPDGGLLWERGQEDFEELVEEELAGEEEMLEQMGIKGEPMGRKNQKPQAELLKSDMKYIRCGVCRKMVEIAYSNATETLKKRFGVKKKRKNEVIEFDGEGAVQDFVEKVRVRARARARLGLGLGLELPEP